MKAEMFPPPTPPLQASSVPGSLEDAYATCTPLLLGALGRLAQRGYSVNPAEGLDLVHDFYVEAFPGVLNRFDASQATFRTYVYAAFVRFARPRIVRSLRWRRATADLDRFPSLEPGALDDFPQEALEAVSDAFSSLPRDLRRVLQARVLEGQSERTAADQLKLTRYVVRQRSAEALGRLAVALGSEERIPASVRPLALRLWRDGLTLAQVEQETGLPRQFVRAAHGRLLVAIEAALLRDQARAKEKVDMAAGFCAVWQQVMVDPADVTALDSVRAHLVELLDHVDECSRCQKAAEDSANPARVYEELGRLADLMSPGEQEAAAQLEQARADSDTEIEEAVRTALLPALPEALQDLEQLGASPLEVFRASNMINHIAYLNATEHPDAPVVLAEEGLTVGGQRVASLEELSAEVGRHAEVSPEVATRLVQWVVDAARCMPTLFEAMRSESDGSAGVRLHLDAPAREVNMMDRWAPAAEARPADLAVALQEALAATKSEEAVLSAASESPELSVQERSILADQVVDIQREAAEIERVVMELRARFERDTIARALAAAGQTRRAAYDRLVKTGVSGNIADLVRKSLTGSDQRVEFVTRLIGGQ